MNECEFCNWFIANNYRQDYKNGNHEAAFRGEKEPIYIHINYCPVCGRKLEELISD